ncbi:MAG TPA: XRE family transcriptional regulator [Spirochaetota bacterium]|jgi:transcriptional regulator with XRE-family HTH domain|nr:helix-turn-helix transcriptional regulator [Spirochaetota bacterium]HPA63830.1 XRE family transcriptional regulator [Spirochaetota bacterium]HPJ14873.1 XRE family transcriptional regulator [Spirochaetota bacterium]HQO21733.1 XRE family transcriptional regulator [Spirochaetota bacterium]HQQ22710.1 XRE family transcriptional regulator [Spirochaetota bacterium]
MADEIVAALGRKIKLYRENRRVTLKELSEKTNVTPSLLSQIENGKASPSLTTLKSIADYFDVSIGALFESNVKTPVSPLTKKSFHKKIVADGDVTHYLISQGIDDFEYLLIEFPAGSTTGTEPYSHEGYECAYLIKGKLTIELDGSRYDMEEGDSISFESHKNHRVINNSAEKAVVLWVDSKPWFFSHR